MTRTGERRLRRFLRTQGVEPNTKSEIGGYRIGMVSPDLIEEEK